MNSLWATKLIYFLETPQYVAELQSLNIHLLANAYNN